MRKEYDFSNAKKNPYASKLKRQITIRIDLLTVEYFKNLADSFGVPYQNLINLYLRDCATNRLEPNVQWVQQWRGSSEQSESPVSSPSDRNRSS